LKTVSILEDCPDVSRALREIIDASGRYHCISNFQTIASARVGLRKNPPDILIFDIGLPDGSGVDFVRWLKPRLKETQFIAFTGQADGELVFQAIDAGATGYLSKGAGSLEWIKVLDELSAGGSPLSPAAARTLLEGFRRENPVSAPAPNNLTQREKEILAELAGGRSLSDIAGVVGISRGTLNTHMRNLYRKLKVHSRNEITAMHFAASRR
jgi:DNA-binding NarL/FixJ family response regulator